MSFLQAPPSTGTSCDHIFNKQYKYNFNMTYGSSTVSNFSYDKCSKISNTFLFLFSNKMLVFRAGIHKSLVRVANREDPDQTASSEAV